jgi:hypothetical protein
MFGSEQSLWRERGRIPQGESAVGPRDRETCRRAPATRSAVCVGQGSYEYRLGAEFIVVLEVLSMKQETSVKVTYGFWGLMIGAAVAMIVGFGWGGWVTGGTVKGKTDEAVLASRAAICVAQFMRAPDRDRDLVAFKATDSWKRSELIGKAGWDKMPGQEQASGSVAEACARGIELLAAK